MKVLVCLFALLAVANAGYLRGNGLYSTGGAIIGGGIRAGSYISPSVAYAPAVHAVQPAVYQTAAYAAPAHIYNSAPIYNSASLYNTAPLVAAGHGLSYGFNNGLSYGNSYALGGPRVYGYGGLKH